MPADSSVIDPIAPLAEEFVARFRNGERPALAEYIARCPEQEARIRQLFPLLAMMEQAVPSEGATVGEHPLVAPTLEQVGGYRILRELGRGGMGVVYEAEQLSLGRRVALKVLPLTPARDGAGLERFRREARAAAHLHHGNIVPVYEVGEEGDVRFYAMQLVRGQPLDVVLDELRRLRQSGGHAALLTAETASLPEKADPSSVHSNRQLYHRSVARIGVQVARALEYAHAQGVIHRDVKPSNLLLDTEGRVWLTDFGLARTDGAALTRTGDVVGTLRYMAPERFSGWSDARSDVYSLGLTLYELLALRPAFPASDQAELLKAILHGEPPPLRSMARDVPRDLETVLARAIDREPGGRYAGAGELADDLERFLEDRPIQARRSGALERAWRWCRRNPAVAGLLAALLLSLVGGLAGVTWAWRAEREQRQLANDNAQLAIDNARKVEEESLKLQQAEAAITDGDQLSLGLRFGEAEAELTRATTLRPDLVRGWQRRAYLYLRLGLWDLAEGDLLPERLSAVSSPVRWLERALLRLLAGDDVGYQSVVADMLAKLAPRENSEASDIVRMCNLSPLAGVDRARLVELSRKRTRAAAAHNWLTLYIQGGALLRAGRGDEAVGFFNRSLGAASFEGTKLNYPMLALALHHAGRPVEARQALEQSREAYENFINRMLSQQDLYTGVAVQFWYDWVEFQVLYREAHQAVEGSPLPEDGRLWSLRARALMNLGRTSDARAAHDRAVRLGPDDLGTRLLRLGFLTRGAEHDEAARERGRVDAICGTEVEKNLIAMRAYSHIGLLDAARSAHQRAAAQRPNDLGVRLAYFRQLNALGRSKEADAAFAEAQKGRQSASFHARCGDALAEMQLWQRAGDEYGKAIAKGSADGQLWYRHAILQHYLGRSAAYRTTVLPGLLARFDRDDQPQAAQWLAQIGLLDPQGADAARTLKLARRWAAAYPALAGDHPLLGWALVRAGQYDEALPLLTRAHARWKWVHITIALAACQEGRGDISEALKWIRQVPAGYRRLGPVAGSRENWDNLFEKQLQFRNAAAMMNLETWEEANRHIGQRRWAPALQQLSRLPESARSRWGYWWLRAACTYELGRRREALRYLEQAARMQPSLEKHLTLHWAFAMLRLDQGDLQGYRDDCARRVAAARPTDSPTAALYLAWYCRLGPGAVKDYAPLEAMARRRLAEADHKQDHYFHLGCVLLRAGKFNEALVQLKKGAVGRFVWEPVDALWLALAYHGAGDEKKAREQLAVADAWRKRYPRGAKAPGPWSEPISWPYWLKVELLHREVTPALAAKAKEG